MLSLCVTLSESLRFLDLSFFICKMEMSYNMRFMSSDDKGGDEENNIHSFIMLHMLTFML